MARQTTSLKAYALTRIGLIIPMILILLTLVFLLMRVAPGDPIEAALSGRVPQSQIDEIKHRLGFDEPLYQQYFDYLKDVAQGDFGHAITDRRAVTEIVAVNGAATLELSVAAMIVAIVVGVGIGLLSGQFRDTPLDVGNENPRPSSRSWPEAARRSP